MTRNITETDTVIIDHDRKLLIEKCSVSKSNFLTTEKKIKNITIKEVQNVVKNDTNSLTETAVNNTVKEKTDDAEVYDIHGVERSRCGKLSFLCKTT